MSYSKVIRKDEVKHYETWEPPAVGEGTDVEHKTDHEHIEKHKLPTADEIAEIQRKAYDESFEKAKKEGFALGEQAGRTQGYEDGKSQGYEEGLAQGQEEINKKIKLFESVLHTLSEPLKELDLLIEQELSALAMAVARHLVRRELKFDPGQVIAAVRQAVSVLPISARDVRVYLHPDDAVLVRDALSIGDSNNEERRWRVVEDASLTRGGCNIESDNSRIDATIETRLAAIIAKALGGERESDNAFF